MLPEEGELSHRKVAHDEVTNGSTSLVRSHYILWVAIVSVVLIVYKWRRTILPNVTLDEA